MLNIINDALTWFNDIIGQFINILINTFFQNIPVMGATQSFYYNLRGNILGLQYSDLFTWFNWTLIFDQLEIITTIFFINVAAMLAFFVIKIIHNIMDSIPILG